MRIVQNRKQCWYRSLCFTMASLLACQAPFRENWMPASGDRPV